MAALTALVVAFGCGACLPGGHAGVVSIHGDGAHRMTLAAAAPYMFRWQPTWPLTGPRFASIGEARRGQRRLLVGRRTILRNAFYPAWSPDGRWIAFVRDDTVWLTRPDGTRIHRLAGRSHGAIFGPLAWSPDSRRVAFVADDVLYVVHRDGTHLVRVSRTPAADPAFSPNGRSVYYLSGRQNAYIAWTPHRHDLSTGRDAIFRARPHPDHHDAAFSPDCRYLAYTVGAPGTGVESDDLWVLRLADGRKFRVARVRGQSFGVAWPPVTSPTPPDRSPRRTR
jgi:dipeptidyl aminopeptidase/acylaminoacyl peptidase